FFVLQTSFELGCSQLVPVGPTRRRGSAGSLDGTVRRNDGLTRRIGLYSDKRRALLDDAGYITRIVGIDGNIEKRFDGSTFNVFCNRQIEKIVVRRRHRLVCIARVVIYAGSQIVSPFAGAGCLEDKNITRRTAGRKRQRCSVGISRKTNDDGF